MDSVQTVTYAEIDRIFTERIRRRLVELGLLPDVLDFQGDVPGYRAAMEAIKAGGEEVSEVFGPAVPENREEKTYNKIVVNRTGKKPGSWGGSGVPFFTSKVVGGETVFDKSTYPDHNYNVTYDIRLITKNTKYDRILCNVMDNFLPGRHYVPTINDDHTNSSKLVLVEFKRELQIPSKLFIERSYQYTIMDVWLSEPVLTKENIAMMEEVSFEIILKPYSEVFPEEIVPLTIKMDIPNG